MRHELRDRSASALPARNQHPLSAAAGAGMTAGARAAVVVAELGSEFRRGAADSSALRLRRRGTDAAAAELECLFRNLGRRHRRVRQLQHWTFE
jgi:hypothetical protein